VTFGNQNEITVSVKWEDPKLESRHKHLLTHFSYMYGVATMIVDRGGRTIMWEIATLSVC